MKKILGLFFAVVIGFLASYIVITATQEFFEKKEENGRVQDIIIRGKLYNCEQVKSD
jgi:hypothetical protein